MNEYELRTVSIDEVFSTDRSRTDMGDIDELAYSFKKYGIIQTLAVAKVDGDKPYRLLAGGRRFEAAKRAKLESIPVKIYINPLTDMEMKSIELEENLRRKELTFMERANLTREIHNLQIAIHGPKISTSPDAPGHSLRDTANLLNVSHATVVNDIKLAEAIEQFPDIGWDRCKNQTEAFKILAKFEERVIRSELSDRAAELNKTSKSKKLIDAYILGDFFEMIKGVPDRTIDLCEVDPPYGIDLQDMQKDHKSTYGDTYNEVEASKYVEFMSNVLKECYRVLKDDSWLILWFGPEPWLETMYQLLITSGFETRRICGIWHKPGGQTMSPENYLANCYEMFFYAKKGKPVINLDKRGRSNVFSFDKVPPSQKICPAERPVPLIEEILKTFVWEGSRIIVPFAGSGNTIRAAFNLNMFPLGYDLTKEYRDGYVARIMEEEKQ